MPSLEFTLLVDAIKLPGIAVAPPNTTYELNWFYSDEHQGKSNQEVAMRDEVEFMLSCKWLVENRAAVGRVLQISLFQHTPGMERELVGVLMIDLNAHIPKPPQRYSRQRATLSMSRCPFEAPVMIRLTIECVHSQLSVQTAHSLPQPTPSPAPLRPSQERTPPSLPVRESSSSIQPIERHVDLSAPSPAPIKPQQQTQQQHAEPIQRSAATEQELTRLKAMMSTMAAANEQLRDENAVLRKAASQARKEKDYTYTVNRPEGAAAAGRAISSSRSQSPSNIPPELELELERLRAESVTQKAEMAVLQKGVMASKEQLRAQMDREHELRAEISSLTRENRMQLEQLSQLERALEEARIGQSLTAANAHGGEVETLRTHLHNAQQAVRDLTATRHANEETIDTLRQRLDEMQVAVKESESRRHLTEQQSTAAIAEQQIKVERCEAALRLGQKEISRLHTYCEEANQRCQTFAKAFEAQRLALERKKQKLADLRSFIHAQNVFAATAPKEA